MNLNVIGPALLVTALVAVGIVIKVQEAKISSLTEETKTLNVKYLDSLRVNAELATSLKSAMKEAEELQLSATRYAQAQQDLQNKYSAAQRQIVSLRKTDREYQKWATQLVPPSVVGVLNSGADSANEGAGGKEADPGTVSEANPSSGERLKPFQ